MKLLDSYSVESFEHVLLLIVSLGTRIKEDDSLNAASDGWRVHAHVGSAYSGTPDKREKELDLRVLSLAVSQVASINSNTVVVVLPCEKRKG